MGFSNNEKFRKAVESSVEVMLHAGIRIDKTIDELMDGYRKYINGRERRRIHEKNPAMGYHKNGDE